jgi:alanine racemase
MIDITPLYNQVKKGDQVVFIGKQGNEEITIDEIADSTNTSSVINLVIQCNVGINNSAARYPRKLIDK